MTGRKPETDELILEPTTDREGRHTFHSSFSPGGSARTKALLAELPAVIPVIFLPGIMGTNLRSRETGEVVWRPPNASFRPTDILGIISALLTWGFKDSRERQELLDGSKLEVDDRGPIDVGGSGLSRETARARGWGTVNRASYNPIMALLQQRLNRMVSLGELDAWWREEGLRDPAAYGEETGRAVVLTEEEVTHAAGYQFEVWCCGYNWLNSNEESAEDLLTYLNEVVFAHYREREDVSPQIDQMKVILVTHSMGGLVARALKLIEGGEKRILGVVHGVQPATGAPAIYHHMRCGYEGAVRFVLGRNAGQVTSVCARSAGALELVPSFDHREGDAWLFACAEGQWDPNNTKDLPLGLPRGGDPYSEIYQTREWYGLVPAQNEKYLDMSGNEAGPRSSARAGFNLLVDATSRFHKALSTQYLTSTYVHYGADQADDMHSWRDVVWQGNWGSLKASAGTQQDDGRGSYRNRRFPDAPKLTKVKGGGDGTVCDWSGAAPGRARVDASFRHGSLGSGSLNNSRKGYGHQNSYNDKGGRAQWATLYGLVKISTAAIWNDET